MHHKLLLYGMLLFSLGLKAANEKDESSSTSESDDELSELELSSITVEEAIASFIDQSKMDLWDISKIPDTVGFVAAVFLFLPGVVPGAVLAGIGCGPSSMHSGVCIAGLSCVSVAVAGIVGSLASIPIAYGRNYCAASHNTHTEQQIRSYFKLRSGDSNVTIQDLKILSMGLSDSLLKRLNISLALSLAELDLVQFRKLVAGEKFTTDINITAVKLLKMIDFDDDTLASNLINPDVQEDLFVKEPVLLQTLLRLLFAQNRNTKAIPQGLVSAFKAVIGEQRSVSDDKLLKAINNIAHGAHINSYLLKTIVVDETSQKKGIDNQVKIKTAQGSMLVNKTKVSQISDYFKAHFSGKWAKKSLDISKVNYDWLEIVINLAEKNWLDLNLEDMPTILKAADFFQVKSITKQCDIYIRDNVLLEQVMKGWGEEENFDPNLFAEKWRFCKLHNLLVTQAGLLPELVERLNGLTIKDEKTIDDLALLDADNLILLAQHFDNERFLKRLNDPEFLSWLWWRGKKINFLKNAVVNFCKSDNNRVTTAQAWLVMPKSLSAAIEKNQ